MTTAVDHGKMTKTLSKAKLCKTSFRAPNAMSSTAVSIYGKLHLVVKYSWFRFQRLNIKFETVDLVFYIGVSLPAKITFENSFENDLRKSFDWM